MDSNKIDDIPAIPPHNIGRVEIAESTSSANVRPSVPFDKTITGPLFAPEEPLIERLAETARPKSEQPTAGSYAIEHVNLDHLPNFPPESLEHEERPLFNLGKSSVDVEYPLSSLLQKPQLKKPPTTSEPTGVDSSTLKDLEAVRELIRDQAVIPKVKEQPSTISGTSRDNNNGNPEEKDGKKGKSKESKRRFSVSGFFKRRSTTK